MKAFFDDFLFNFEVHWCSCSGELHNAIMSTFWFMGEEVGDTLNEISLSERNTL